MSILNSITDFTNNTTIPQSLRDSSLYTREPFYSEDAALLLHRGTFYLGDATLLLHRGAFYLGTQRFSYTGEPFI